MGFYLGCSAAFVTVGCYAASLVDPNILKRAPYLYDFLSDADFAQLGYLMGFIIASTLSVTMSGVIAYEHPSVQNPWLSFIGGFLILFGSR
jgi:hypothetical protein